MKQPCYNSRDLFWKIDFSLYKQCRAGFYFYRTANRWIDLTKNLFFQRNKIQSLKIPINDYKNNFGI